MKEIILLIAISTLLTGCTLEKQDRGLPDCVIENVQSSIDLDVYRLRCPEAKYRCIKGLYGISCLPIEKF